MCTGRMGVYAEIINVAGDIKGIRDNMNEIIDDYEKR